MFIVPSDREGILLERQMDTLDSSFIRAGIGRCGLKISGSIRRIYWVSPAGRNGQAQVRLAPARLTHCMRWLGSARRAHGTALDYANRREVFGQKLGKHEVGFMLADNEMDIRTARLSLMQAAWLLDQGDHATEESSMAKVQCSEAIWRIVDNAVQILGGAGTRAPAGGEDFQRSARLSDL